MTQNNLCPLNNIIVAHPHYHIVLRSFKIQAPLLIVGTINEAISAFEERKTLVKDLTGANIISESGCLTCFDSGDELFGFECFSTHCELSTKDPSLDIDYPKEEK